MPVFKIHHVTKYHYTRPVVESVNQIRIYPVASPQQEILHHDVSISEKPDMNFFIDYWGNRCSDFSLVEPHTELVIDSRLIVRTLNTEDMPSANGTLADVPPYLIKNYYLLDFLKIDDIEQKQKITSILDEISKGEHTILKLIEACSSYVYHNFKYSKGITDIETTVDEILEHKGGVCQDFAHVLLHLLRCLGIPARYVSGYICPNKNGMRGEGATHAWVEGYIPQLGWVGVDPTNNVWTATHHVKLAVGRNFNDCTPLKGTFKGLARQTLSVYVSVGYEDGHIFEDVNNVTMQVAESQVTEELLALEAAEQQQQ